MVNTENALLEKLNNIIDENLTNSSFSIDSLVQNIGISRSQLHRFIKEYTFTSTSLYVRHRRLLKAKSLLKETDLRVSEVAYQVGIDIPQNFSKYFTKAFSISPSDYRNESKSKPQDTSDIVLENSIAVLPFVNMSGTDEEYFSDGITEEIINVLAHVGQLKVAGRTSCFRFKGKTPDLRELGNLLSVNYILEGSVRKSKNKLRITAQLIKVSDGFHMWSETYERQLIDIFDIQDEISLAILQQIKIKLLGDTKETLLKRSTNNPEAYQLFLQGRFCHYKFADNDTFYRAIEFYKAAIKLEPTYANAYAGMAHCYMHLWFFSELPPAESILLAKTAIKRALEIDLENADSHNADGEMKLWFDWDFDAAKIAFEKAYELNPNLPEIHMHYGMYFGLTKQYELCDEHFAKAISLDPFCSLYYSNWGLMKWMEGDLKGALSLAETTIFKASENWTGYYLKALVLLEQQNYKEAMPLALTTSTLYPSGNTLGLLALVYTFLGEQTEVKKLIGQIEQRVASGLTCNYDLGQLYVANGEFMKGYHCFEKALDLHEGRMLMIHQAFRRTRYFKESPEFAKFFENVTALQTTQFLRATID
jgi:adenylate cyclase